MQLFRGIQQTLYTRFNHRQSQAKAREGFTIVELIVVISVIAVLAGISIVSYGAWETSTKATQVKNELNAAAGTMTSNRNFSDSGYAADVTVIYDVSSSVVLTGGSSDGGETFCLDAVSADDAAIEYYLASETLNDGPLEGTCAGRDATTTPDIPTNVVAGLATGNSVEITWSAVSGADEYVAQCASDAAFIFGLQQVTSQPTTTTVSDLTPSSSFYCRVKAVNNIGESAWSASVSTATTNAYGTLAVASSIEGYWSDAPEGYLLEDGAAVSRTIYSELFAVIGTTYGAGDGSTTFNVPNSKSRTPVNQNIGDVEFATVGQQTGSLTETLTENQIPGHSHDLCIVVVSGGETCNTSYTSITWGTGSSGQTGTVRVPMDGSAVENSRATGGTGSGARLMGTLSSGGDGAHNNIQPSIVKSFAIKYSPPNTSAPTLPVGVSIGGYWSSAPSGYLLEDGAAVSRAAYSDLFTLLGTTYGSGDGSTTFNLPDSQGYAPVAKSNDVEFLTIGQKYGTKQETVSVSQMPDHDHDLCINSASGSYSCNTSFGIIAWGTGSSSDAGTIRVPTSSNSAMNSRTTGSSGTSAHLVGTRSTGDGQSHNNIQQSIVRKYAIKSSVTSSPGGSAVAVGTTLQGYWTAAPLGYLVEDGAAVSRTTYASLFSSIGTTYGPGDGSTTFNLPDSTGRVSVGIDTADSRFDQLGEKYGEKTHTLTVAEMPSHTHDLCINSQPWYYGCNTSFSTLTWATGSSSQTGTIRTPSVGSPVENSRSTGGGSCCTRLVGTIGTGGSAAHNNIQPSIVKLFVIKH